MNILLVLLSLLPAIPQEADPAQGKCTVVAGKTSGVFYGMSAIADLWGNMRRQVCTLKPDGSLLFGAPDGSFEDYVRRAPTAEEKANLATYSIDAEKFSFTYRDGSKGDGSVEYAPDRTIKLIRAMGLFLYPIRSGLSAPLTGYWNNTFSFSNGAYKMTTTVATSYSFFAGGIFAHESAAGTIATGVETRTRETSAGLETVRQEVTKFYGNEAAEKMGKYEVKGSSLTLVYDSGKKETRFVGQVGDVKAGEDSLVIIGNSLYSGRFGVFPKATGPAPSPAAIPAAGLARCASEHFDLAVPKGWHARQEDLEGIKAFLLTPAEDADGKFTVVLTGTGIDSKSTKGTDPEMVSSLEVLITAWVKGEKPRKDGATETFMMGGVEAARVKYSFVKDGATVKLEGACGVRDGHAIVAITVATEDSLRRHGAAGRELLTKVGFPEAAAEPKVELQRVKGEGFELDVPKAWTAKTVQQGEVKTLMIVPPSGEADYVVQFIPSDAGLHASAAAPAAIQELRDLVTQLAPALKPVGSVESLQADGRPASGVVYGGRNEKDETILVKAYLAMKAKKAVVVLVVGKESRDKEYGGRVRKAVESLILK